MFHLRCCLSCRQSRVNFLHQQTATYLLPPLPEVVEKRLNKHRCIKFEESSYIPEVHLKNEKPPSIAAAKRRFWARNGSISGINPSHLFPSKPLVEWETKAEEHWWPTLQKLQENVRLEDELKAQEKMERDKKIAENMSKMPQWIEKFHAEQQALATKEQTQSEKRQIEIEMAKEAIGYDIASNHPLMVEYMENLKLQRKKEKKAAKRRGQKKRDFLSGEI